MKLASIAAVAATGVLLAAAPGLEPAARAADAYEVHVILPLTGGGAFIGNGIKANYEAVEAVVNRSGAINGAPLKFVFDDDQTSPQRDVQIASGVFASKPPVVLGSAIVGLCNAMAPLAANGPVMYCLSPSFQAPQGGFTFSAGPSTEDQVAALIRYFRLKGWTKLGVLNSIDTTGQNADKAIARALALDENKSMKIVEHQHFNPTDVSVTAQMERIKGAGAQSLIAWTTGAQVATVFKAMIQSDLNIPIGTSSGNQTFAQMEQYTSFLPKQLLIGSGLFPEHDGVIKLDARVEKAQHDMYAVMKERNVNPDISTTVAWDTGLLVAEAFRKLGPKATAVQVRDYIRGLTNFAGIDGIYDFKAHYDRGLGPDSATVVSYDAAGKRWKWLSKPGGEPLP
jgi:branched-chain amino acid transport system substrate-binding protein